MKRRTLLTAAALTVPNLALPNLANAADSKTMRFIPQADLAILDPGITTATVTRNHAFLVFDTLYGLSAGGEPIPEMVAGHVMEDDGKRWTMTLREGLRFHDNTPVLASDCVASLRRWGQRDAFGKTLMASTDELAAPDDRTIVFRLRAPFPLLPLALAKTVPRVPFIMPARLLDGGPDKPVPEMVGSGPFRFLPSERVPGARVTYERFAGYVPRPGGARPGLSAGPKIANVDRVEWHVIPDAATALAAIERGEIDWWERPIPDLILAAQADKSLKVAVTNVAGTIAFVQFNHLHPPFNNPAIRRLVLSAIDQSDMTAAIGGSDPALLGGKVGIFLPGGPMASDAGLEALAARTDFDKMKQELVAAGYKDEPVVMLVGSDSPVNSAGSAVMADMLRKMGFNIDYVSTDWGSVVQRRTSQQPPDKGGWNLFVVSADGDYFLDPTVAPAIRANGKDAWIGWPDSAALEALYKAWFSAPDQPARQSIAKEMQLQTWKDVPYIPLAQVFLPTVVRNNVTGVLPGFPKFWNVAKT